jgi:hypothetical protein
MSRFIDDLLVEKAQKQRAALQAHEWIMFCAKTIEAQAPYFWEGIIRAIQSSLPPSTVFGLKSPTKFILHKPIYPAFDLTVEVDFPAQRVTYRARKKSGPEADFTYSDHFMPFYLDDAAGVYLKRGDDSFNPDSFAEFIVSLIPE